MWAPSVSLSLFSCKLGPSLVGSHLLESPKKWKRLDLTLGWPDLTMHKAFVLAHIKWGKYVRVRDRLRSLNRRGQLGPDWGLLYASFLGCLSLAGKLLLILQNPISNTTLLQASPDTIG